MILPSRGAPLLRGRGSYFCICCYPQPDWLMNWTFGAKNRATFNRRMYQESGHDVVRYGKKYQVIKDTCNAMNQFRIFGLVISNWANTVWPQSWNLHKNRNINIIKINFLEMKLKCNTSNSVTQRRKWNRGNQSTHTFY